MRKLWANIVDMLAFLALWWIAGTAMCQTGCGSDPCDECPSGTRCQRIEAAPGSINPRWACVQTVKLIERRPFGLGAGSGDLGVSD